MNLCAGIDMGSATAKAVIVGEDGRVAGLALLAAGYDTQAAGRSVLREALAQATGQSSDTPDGREAARHHLLTRVVATGYGRHAVEADTAVTEITCHARGAAELVPDAGSVIDVGGQDSKAIALGAGGRVLDFVMNDKCAAGTGRFLEVMARALEVPLDRFGPFSLSATRPAEVSNTCTVFAESEVISLRAARTSREDIIAGIHRSMARRIAGMARRVDLRPRVVMTGGVARNDGLVRAVELELGLELVVPELAQYAGALGAALLAREQA